MQTVSNYDGIITIPSKMNDLEEWEVNLMFPQKKDIPVYPLGICFHMGKNLFEVKRSMGNRKIKYIGYKKTSKEAIILLEKYCTKHKLKLF